MGQEGIPLSIGVIVGATILGAIVLVGMVLMAVLG